jgi:hypothetical protein
MKQIVIRMPDDTNPQFIALLVQLRALPLIRMEEQILDPLDIDAQLDDMRGLTDGWLDGQGLAPPAAGLDWLAAAFAQYWSSDLPKPRLYPTPEGGVQAEWRIGSYRPSLEIDLTTHSAYGHFYNLTTQAYEEKDLDLNQAASWEWITTRIDKAKGE